MRLGYRMLSPGKWGEPATRPRVLLENNDTAIQAAAIRRLAEAGYEVATCDGPDKTARRRCPLVATGRCDLAEGADVIVHSLNTDRPANAEVLEALRARFPGTPVVVEATEAAIVRHRDLFAGCRIVRFPMTGRRLVDAVHAALAEPGPCGIDGSR